MQRLKFGFSVISNIRNPTYRAINNRITTYDENIDRYEDLQVIAYTHKRRVKKQEVPAKIYILENQIEEIRKELENQVFAENMQVLQMNIMAALYEQMKISSAYIFSKFQEKHLKQLLANYSEKVLMSGKMPPMSSIDTYNKLAQKATQLYRVFYFGEQISELEQLIESEYLSMKVTKYNNYQKSYAKSLKKKNQLLRCVWNQQNQRSLEGYDNWQSRPFDDYADFRPFYKNIVLASYKSQNNQNFAQHQLIGQLSNLSPQSIQFVSIQLFNRLLQWCGSLQFTRVLKLPADFLIQLSIISAHVWMIVYRLNKQKDGHLLTHSFIKKFQQLLMNKLGQISAQTNSLFHIDVYQKFMLHWKAYESHFQFLQNPYSHLDSLVYSTILLSKDDRNSDTILLIGQYFIRNYNKINSMDIKDVLNGNIEFDVYMIDPDYKSKFSKSLQPYPFQDSLKNILLPLEKPVYELENKSFSTKIFRIMNVLVKGLKSFDYYSEVEKQQKQNKAIQQTGWNFKDDIEQEMSKVQKLRLKYKKKQL